MDSQHRWPCWLFWQPVISTFACGNKVLLCSVLVKSKCLPILLYGLECCNLRSADLHSLEFTYNRLFMKLFRTKSIDVVKDCQYFFGAVLKSVLVLRKADKLALRYQCLENAFCTYCRSIHRVLLLLC